MHFRDDFLITIENIMKSLSFPSEAMRSLLEDAKTLKANADVFAEFLKIVKNYDLNMDMDFEGAKERLMELSDCAKISVYAMNMLFFLSLCPRLKERYRENGLSDKLFQDTIQDIRFKLYECQIVHNAWGTHAFDWLTRFFRKMDRFFFVRLQFEPAELKFDCTVCGKQYKAGAKVLNVHIPRTGTPLNHDAVIASYREAAEFFADYFQGDPTLIVCNSWLLNPQHEEFLKQDSNILLFAHDYTIIDVHAFDDYVWLWRVFERPFDGDIDSLPADTSVRRSYVALLKRGSKLNCAYGVISYDDFMKQH